MELSGSKMDTVSFQPTAHSLISWRAIFAGLLATFTVYMVLMALGTGIGGSAAIGMAREGDADGLGAGIGIWVAVSALVALFTGGYFAARCASFKNSFSTSAYGFLVAGLFFVAAMFGAGQMLGAAGSGLGKLAGVSVQGAANLAENPTVQASVLRAVGSANLRSDVPTIARNLSTYIARGDEQGAKAYFASETGLSQAEVDTRIAALQAEMREFGEAAARGVAATGWTLFATMVLGLAASIWGAFIGLRIDAKVPHTSEDRVRSGRLTPNPV